MRSRADIGLWGVEMFQRAKKLVLDLHRDERGPPEASTVLIAALIMIPLIVLLINFGKDIADWLKEKWQSIGGMRSTIPSR
jgi:hypothetical protein